MKPYVRPMPATWWIQRRPYFIFMLRELSSVFIAAYLMLLLVMIHRVSQGPEAYLSFLRNLRSPAAIFFHVVALAFALLHTITWFNLTPQAVAVYVGEERVRPGLIIAPNYVAWVIASAIVAWFVLKG
jgi:fumarate reductase subunit C